MGESRTCNKVPEHIKVLNLRLPETITSQTSLLKIVRAKLNLLETLLKPLLPKITEKVDDVDDEQRSSSQVLIFHNYKIHSQIIVDHLRAKVRRGKH